MDFSQFLQNSSNENKTSGKKQVDKNTNKSKQINSNNIQKQPQTQQTNPNTQIENTTQVETNNNNLNTFKNLKRGDYVKIIRVKDSHLNIYKAYIGEIREYRKDQDHALVFIHAMASSHRFIKFPLTHLEKYDLDVDRNDI